MPAAAGKMPKKAMTDIAKDKGCSKNGVAGSPKVKEKRRNNEKRKEKSRDAARCRRSRETEIFTDLASVLPARREEVEQLDKASIMRLSIAYLKVRGMLDLFPHITEITKMPTKTEEQIMEESLIMQALDGFLLILSEDGDVTYVSENVSDFLGIQQVDMIGQQIWDYSHQCDHEELREILHGRRVKDTDDQLGLNRDMFMRLKCTITSRGRSVNIKSASYKVIHLWGHIAGNEKGQRQLVAVGRPLPHPSNIEVPLDSGTFLTKHSLDMKFSYVDDKMSNILGYQPEHLLNQSLYEYHHTCDSESLMGTFKNVISKGQAETCRYRFLARKGGYCWVVTQATLVYDKQKPQSVVCVNYIISGIENENEIYSCAQLEAANETIQKECGKVKTEHIPSVKSVSSPVDTEPILSVPIKTLVKPLAIVVAKPTPQIVKEHRPRSVTASIFSPLTEIPPGLIALQQQQQQQQALANSIQQPRAQTVTASVFTPLTVKSNVNPVTSVGSPIIPPATASILPANTSAKVTATVDSRKNTMNKGFLMYLEEGTELSILKEEPDDLTHLAPTAGDACIPLDDPAPLFGEMFDGLMLPDGYGTLLPDDIALDSSHHQTNSKTHIDPFMNYREESCDTIGTPNLLSPSGLSKSPNGSSIPSLCSPNSLSQEDEFAFMSMNCEDGIDLTMRAPYIPMNENDDLPLLTEDLMWSAFSEELSLHKDIKEAIHNESIKESSLAALLSATGVPQSSTESQQTRHASQQIDYRKSRMNADNQDKVDVGGGTVAAGLVNDNVVGQCGGGGGYDGDAGDDGGGGTCDDGIHTNDGSNENCVGDELICPVNGMGQIYNKNCTNHETWTMTDLLQINGTSNHKNTNTINPMLIHSNSVIKKPDRTVNKRPLNISTLELCNSTTKRIKGLTTFDQSPKQQHQLQQNQQHHSNHQQRVQQQQNNIQQQQHQNHNNNYNQQQQSAPQLLQQLMAPTPQQQRARSKGCNSGGGGGNNLNCGNDKWDMENASQNHMRGLTEQQLQQQSASNSVLKNLLVSGCDVSAGYICAVPMRSKKALKA